MQKVSVLSNETTRTTDELQNSLISSFRLSATAVCIITSQSDTTFAWLGEVWKTYRVQNSLTDIILILSLAPFVFPSWLVLSPGKCAFRDYHHHYRDARKFPNHPHSSNDFLLVC